MTSVLLKQQIEGILTLTLNRPAQLNALTWELMRLLNEALEEASVDPGVRVVVLTGTGRGFCSGGDLRSREQIDAGDPVSVRWSADPVWKSVGMRASHVKRLSQSPILLHTMPKPTIAMLRGPVVGAGLCLAAACDFRIASQTASFATAYVRAARPGDFGGSYLLPRVVGPAKARELYLLGDKIAADEALRIGLVNRVVPDTELETETQAFANRLDRGPPVAYRYIKRSLNAAESMTLEQVIELEAYNMMQCSASEDAKEVLRAIRDGREPKYSGY
ncbi:2-(1,2-epoxy-1,2-dihydrophenyl)acetyl-CoA isomerase [Steroidobacter denitrificans]|uniref:2-(1,2-epoxy-1,2-dihydrophenyl)acetyl-CoA isomerase n=1 Tax=Steroidobacter denitrificans TaxID=465721 RepID=A0A127F765_STEDE|nr:enoyl-CoA hydratase [Steroidobacter denitrificans]AMN46264.1 2-(1,2-epoxy-1,2-dihydrophenyl)acetyl-CoA isomerase [Steroidobacter denitrificans]